MEYFGIRQNYTTPCTLLTPRIWPCTTFHNDCSYRNFRLLDHHGFLNSVHYHLTLLFAICFCFLRFVLTLVCPFRSPDHLITCDHGDSYPSSVVNGLLLVFAVGLPLPITRDHPITAVTAILRAYLYFSLMRTVLSSSSFTSRIFS